MKNELGFFAQLYEGRLAKEMLFRDYGASIDEAKVADFMSKYEKLIASFPASEIEAIGRVPDGLMKGMKDIGLFGLLIEKEFGGLGMTLSEYLRVVEEMSRFDMALVLVPLAHLSIGLKGILLYGNPEQKKKYLTPSASGQTIFAYALTEPKIGSDAQHVETQAKLSDDKSFYLLNGTKTYITNANYAGAFTVFAQLDPESRPGYMGAFIVERDWPGVSVGADMPKMGLKVSSTATIRFQDVRVPVENLLGEPGDGFKIAMNILNYGRLGLGAASAGLMNQSVQDMLKRSISRKQFSVPIGDFELIQEKIVRSSAHALASRAMTFFTALLLEENPLMNVAMESSHTKLYGTTRGWDSLYDALQTAGGSGFISTQPYEKRMRDARVTTIFEGTTEIHSIYPSLTVFRTWGKLLKDKKKTPLSVLLDLTRPRLGALRFSDRLLNSGVKVAVKLERRFRSLASLGLRRYGKAIVSQEYFLRCMTEASLHAFALLAAVSFLQWQMQSVKGPKPSDLAAYRYLMNETKEVLRKTPRRGISSLEDAARNSWKELRLQAHNDTGADS